mmetsp:Transcript_38171/g.91380  ORF Transcript_38171/g.91380 Transcript_38171/m.91380 type:complete len:234 (+) Transcript_38171:411-1112(+)
MLGLYPFPQQRHARSVQPRPAQVQRTLAEVVRGPHVRAGISEDRPNGALGELEPVGRLVVLRPEEARPHEGSPAPLALGVGIRPPVEQELDQGNVRGEARRTEGRVSKPLIGLGFPSILQQQYHQIVVAQQCGLDQRRDSLGVLAVRIVHHHLVGPDLHPLLEELPSPLEVVPLDCLEQGSVEPVRVVGPHRVIAAAPRCGAAFSGERPAVRSQRHDRQNQEKEEDPPPRSGR